MVGIMLLCAVAIGFGIVSFVMTLVGDTNEFITTFGTVMDSAPEINIFHIHKSESSHFFFFGRAVDNLKEYKFTCDSTTHFSQCL